MKTPLPKISKADDKIRKELGLTMKQYRGAMEWGDSFEGLARRLPPTDCMDFTYYTMPTKARRKLDVGDIYDNKIKCLKCGWFIRSKNRHDFVRCKCGAVAVDGGSWYQKTVGNPKDYQSYITYFKYRPRK